MTTLTENFFLKFSVKAHSKQYLILVNIYMTTLTEKISKIFSVYLNRHKVNLCSLMFKILEMFNLNHHEAPILVSSPEDQDLLQGRGPKTVRDV